MNLQYIGSIPISKTCELEAGTQAVYLTEKEVNLFLIFRQYQSIWEKVFCPETKNCKVQLEFNHEGVLRSATVPKTYSA